jgi:hypothetical protein
MTIREKYYQRILEESRIRHKKVDGSSTISTPVEKKVNWEKLSEHFKKMVYGKNMDGHLERVDVTIHKT